MYGTLTKRFHVPDQCKWYSCYWLEEAHRYAKTINAGEAAVKEKGSQVSAEKSLKINVHHDKNHTKGYACSGTSLGSQEEENSQKAWKKALQMVEAKSWVFLVV